MAAYQKEQYADGYGVGCSNNNSDMHELHLNASKEEIEDWIQQILKFDPYPCVLGIPVKPALFATSKVYIFICFSLISTKILYDLIKELLTPRPIMPGGDDFPF